VVIQALSQLEDTPSLAEYNAIVLASAEWHPGVVGIAANRLMDQYGKPTILIALRPDGLGRGSARSVPDCDIHRALKTQAHLLTGFGGHPLAAGLAITPENITEFRRGISAALVDCEIAAEKTITIATLVELPQISMDLLNTIQKLAPFGAGNPPVILGSQGLQVLEESLFGKTGTHRRLLVADEAGHQQEVIWWGGANERVPESRFDLAFKISSDDYRSGDAVQVEWLDAREWESSPVAAPPEFIDWRTLPNLQSQLSTLNNPLIWAEGTTHPNFAPLPRHKLHPADTLVIWTAPPGQDILQQALATVRPRQIYLVGQPSMLDTFPAFINQLLGLVKYVLTHMEGEVDLAELAAVLSHRITTARLGINWLVAQGKLTTEVDEDELLFLRPAQGPPTEAANIIEEALKSALAETAAYRRFFQQASLASLEQSGGHSEKSP